MSNDTDLISQSEFGRRTGRSQQAVSKAVKRGDLEEYNGTGKIDYNARSSMSYRTNLSDQFLHKDNTALKHVNPDDLSPELGEAITEVQQAEAKLKIEKAKKEKEARIKLQMGNAVRRSELYESELVESQLFLYLDRVHSNLDRLAGSSLTDIIREAIVAGELKPEHKLKWKDACKAAVHEAKLEIMDRLETIKETQARG